MHIAGLNVFVVHDQQPVFGAALVRVVSINRIKVHAVVVTAHLHALFFARIFKHVLGVGSGDGSAVWDEHVAAIAVGDHDGIGIGYRNSVEP